MGNTLGNSQNSYLQNLYSGLLNNTSENIDKLSNLDINTQKSNLTKLFSQIADNDVNSSEKASLEAEYNIVKKKLDKIKTDMESLKDKIDSNKEKIAELAGKIKDLSEKIASESTALEEEQQAKAKVACNVALKSAIAKYQKDPEQYKNGLTRLIQSEIEAELGKDKYQVDPSDLQGFMDELDGFSDDVDKLTSVMEGFLEQNTRLQNQYGAASATEKLLAGNLEQIGNTNTSYKNQDATDTRPIYTDKKLDTVTNLFKNQFVEAGENTNLGKASTSSSAKLTEITKKYEKYFSKNTTAGVDAYSTDNAAVKNLGNALNAGLAKDIQNAGLTKGEVANFFASNFAGAKITCASDGTFTVPWGHRSAADAKNGKSHSDSQARTIYNKVTSLYQNAKADSVYLGELDTKSAVGNTISSNKQLAKLSENNNYQTILRDLAGKGFTFKEAMYAMFDKNNGVFKNAGINYSLADQKTGANYSINPAGDSATANLYQGIANEIKNLWGVTSDNELGNPNLARGTKPSDAAEKIDPLTFSLNGMEYGLVIDNGDGKFNYADDFVGANKDTDWLHQLISIAGPDGVISDENELETLKLFGVSYSEGEKSTTKRYAGKEYVSDVTTNVEYKMTNAKNLGISEIDLTAYAKKDAEGNIQYNEDGSISWDEDLINKAVGNKVSSDINGSDVFSDSVAIKFADGKEVSATRKDDTKEFLEAIYGAAANKSFTIGYTEKEASEIINASYSEYFETLGVSEEEMQEIVANLRVLEAYDYLRNNAETQYREAMNEIGMNGSIAKNTTTLARAMGTAVDMDSNKAGYTESNQAKTEEEGEENNVEMDKDYLTDKDIEKAGFEVKNELKDVTFRDDDRTDKQIKEILHGLFIKNNKSAEAAIEEFMELTSIGSLSQTNAKNKNAVVIQLLNEGYDVKNYTSQITSLIESGASVEDTVAKVKEMINGAAK